jgi:hypothetical protein
MTAKELRDYLLTKMTAEEALLKLLQNHVEHYEKLKVQMDNEQEGDNTGSPIMIIAAAAMDLGWQLAIENGEPDAPVRGLCVGTGEYLDKILKQ